MAISKMAQKLFLEVCKNDDRLGRYSDHEGDDGGPTYYMWSQGYAIFRSHCIRSIRDHMKAVETMKKLQKLNEARKIR